jgi:eukaryotic-like serine/threonine-protein kinase
MTSDDFSAAPTAAGLPAADQERLAKILDDYLVAAERGAPVAPDELLKQYPADAEYLRCYLSGLQIFHEAATPHHAAGDLQSFQQAVEAGRMIADFSLLREIGRGGMGVVYEALQTSLRRRVALKVLPFSSAHDEKQIGRFRNEAQAAAQVRHPNIVPVYAIGEEHGVHYYAMELIEGQSLAALMHRLRGNPDSSSTGDTTIVNNSHTVHEQRRPIKPRTARKLVPLIEPEPMDAGATAEHICKVTQWGIEAAEALHAAHEYGVIHRDVKPSNLLLDEQGKLWITDFGLARCRESTNLTQSGDILGTMRYMSPEQALGRNALVDHRTDVYSLGITLYELAALRHPADDVGDLQLFFDRTRSNYRPLRHWNAHIPRDFETIVMKAIAEFPHERYATAQEMADDLARFLEGKPILASRPNLATRAGKWAKRHRGAVYAAAGMVLIAMAVLSVSLVAVEHEKAKKDVAYKQLFASQEKTKAKEEFAQQNYQRAREMLDRVGSRVAEQLEKKPGAAEIRLIRLELLNSISDYYQQFIEQAATDPTLDADNPLLNANLAVANSKIGELTKTMGDTRKALGFQQKARDIWEKLADEAVDLPSKADNLQKAAQCDNTIGMLLVDLARPEEAVRVLEGAESTQAKLLAADAQSTRLASDLATTENALGLALMRTGANDEAAKKFRDSIARLETLRQLLPKDGDVLRTLAASYNNLGFLSSKSQDWETAERNYRQSIGIQETLAAAATADGAIRRELAVSSNNLGMVQSQEGHLGEAESSFQKSLEIQKRLLVDQPQDIQALSNLGGVYNNLGMLNDRRGRWADAEPQYREAIRYQRQAFERAADSESVRELLSKHYFNYARNLREQNKPTQAAEVALERRKLWPGEAERLYSVAQELTTVCQLLSGEPDPDPSLEGKYGQFAVDTLREAVAAGLSADRLRDDSLKVLSDREDFQRMLAEAHRDDGNAIGSAVTESRPLN